MQFKPVCEIMEKIRVRIRGKNETAIDQFCNKSGRGGFVSDYKLKCRSFV